MVKVTVQLSYHYGNNHKHSDTQCIGVKNESEGGCRARNFSQRGGPVVFTLHRSTVVVQYVHFYDDHKFRFYGFAAVHDGSEL